MTADLTFLPYLRRGTAAAIIARDPLSGPLVREVSVPVWVEVEGQQVTKDVILQTADQVIGIDARQIVRSEPQPDSTDVEPNYFALVEVAAPGLPWLMTPAAPDGRGRLRPWLVLVVVRRQDGVRIGARSTTQLPVLTIEPPAVPASELPDLTDSWAWAHVQSSAPPDRIAADVRAGSSSVLARLMCPRRLDPNARYVACLVPAFDGAVLRGLGDLPEATAELAPAWNTAAMGDRIDLPVYHMWEFSTGDTGGFEALCRRLRPDSNGAEMGLHAMDVSDPGLVTASGGRVLLDMEGALLTTEAVARDWAEDHRMSFQNDLKPVLDAALARREYDPLVKDPILAPPVYGADPAQVPSIPGQGWVHTLNLHPVRRAAAGLGAAAVRAHQDELVAAAWAQAGELRTAISAVNNASLAAEVGESWGRRVRALPPADVVQFTRKLHPMLTDGERSVRASIVSSGVPPAVFSSAYLRLTRPGATLWRGWQARTGRIDARLAVDHVGTVLEATRPGAAEEVRSALQFAAYVLPKGAQTNDPTLQLADTAFRSTRAVPMIQAIEDISEIADTICSALTPQQAVRTSVVARIPALADVLGSGALPSSFTIAPRFEDALYWDLLGLGAEWILPGVDRLRRNRVRLLSVNGSFVGSFLVGANTEIGRELLWRGYPIDLRGTFFHRFWHYVLDPEQMDIGDLDSWHDDETITQNLLTAGETMTAIVVRGDVVRRYPSAHWFLQRAALDDEGAWSPVEKETVEVTFLGALDEETAVFGFDLTPKAVRGDRANGVGGYFVAVEEQLGGPRFGLDEAKPAHFRNTPERWDQLSWGHLVADQPALDLLSNAHTSGTRIDGLEIDGTTWGHNAAHVATATWQRPFRMLIHADLLI